MVDADTRRAIETLVAAALADGELADAERQLLHRKATEWDIPLPMLNNLLERGQRGELRVSIPASGPEKESLFNDLIDIACADGRVEAPEYHLLAKFASHLGLALADLRARVKQRLEKKPLRVERTAKKARPPEPKPETVVQARPAPPSAPGFDRTLPTERASGAVTMANVAKSNVTAPSGPMALELSHAPGDTSVEAPIAPPGPIQLDTSRHLSSPLPEIPPIALQLLKQAILFESVDSSVRTIERMMELARPEALELRRRILKAFPDLQTQAR